LEAASSALAFAFRLADDPAARADTGSFAQGDVTLALLGNLEDAGDLALRLAAPAGRSAAQLAHLAFERWGEDLPSQMPGEWSLVRWDGARRELIAAVSATLRDPLYAASDGRRVAIAPSIRLLSRLDWVQDDLDPEGVAINLSNWDVRAANDHRTYLADVHRVEHGTMHRFQANSHRKTIRRPPAPLPPWRGDFASGVAALEARARQVVREHLARHGDVAVLLSGGLDSSLIAVLATQERRAGQKVTAISSVARPEDGLPDERRFIQIVARHLDIPVVWVTPDRDADVYCPSDEVFAHGELLVTGPRHYLYPELYRAARQAGATVVFGGEFGEAHLTRNGGPTSLFDTLRRIKQRGIQLARDRRLESSGNYLCRPSAYVRELSRQALNAPATGALHRATRDRPIGPSPAEPRAGRVPTETQQVGLRHVSPFADPGLASLAAAMPRYFTNVLGLQRSLGRGILDRHLPAAIARRPDKMGISPDYDIRLVRGADAARRGLERHRQAGAARWLDLDWLDAQLAALSRGETRPVLTRMEVQATAMAAAFFSWWAAD
jgi:asparagine synthase (glutamine-hydrolysing)